MRGEAALNRNGSRCTGKERDETGLDYFGARYYSNGLSRFLTPDWSTKPLTVPFAKFGDPQTLNLYAYVGNNPSTRLDPDGHYVCQGNATQCGTVSTALSNVQTAANKLAQGNQQQKKEADALKKVLKFYGAAGKKNGVTVKFGDLGGKREAQTDSSRSFFGAKRTTITFDLSSMNKDFGKGDLKAESAGTAAHEGAHGVDGIERGGRNPENKSEEHATEVNAFSAQADVMKGLGANSLYGLNDPSDSKSAAAIQTNADSATDLWCQTGGNCQ